MILWLSLQSEFIWYILCRVKKYVFNNLEPTINKMGGGGGGLEHTKFSHISKSTSWRIPTRYHLNQYVRLIANAAPIIPISALNTRAQ